MGYSEKHCHICGVSFNIGRIRKSDEPRSAAWGPRGPMMKPSLWDYTPFHVRPFEQRFGSFVEEDHHPTCEKDAGCMLVDRGLYDDSIFPAFKVAPCTEDMDLKNESSDADSIPEDVDEEDEPLEYFSEDDEQTHQGIAGQTKDVSMTDDDKNEEEVEGMTKEQIREFWLDNTTYTLAQMERLAENHDGYPSWYRTVPYHIPFDLTNSAHEKRIDICHSVLPEHPVPPRPRLPDNSNQSNSQFVEHIAGPRCQNHGGYSGYEISVEEMRGCKTLQCLVRKPVQYIDGHSFEQLPDDEKFEITGEFFLSGLSDHMPARDCYPPVVTPARHACEVPDAENWIDGALHPQEQAIPFHPYCLEVFKHTSRVLKGKVDINALTSWYSLESNRRHFDSFPRHSDVQACNKQFWAHRPGTAYLAANPLYVPKLREVFSSVVVSDLVFDYRAGAFTTRPLPSTQAPNDPFASLPAEIVTTILDLLPSKSIAALRLTSRAFSQIPIIYFQSLLHREMPWLWEAWPTLKHPSSQTKYATWATMTASQVLELFAKPDRDIAHLEDYVRIVTHESHIPELGSYFTDEVVASAIANIEAAHREKLANIPDRNPFFLPPNRTNYYKLYTLITRHWTELRGLRNRARIWKDCEEILRRTDEHKREGRMDENGNLTQSLSEIVSEHERFWMRETERRLNSPWIKKFEDNALNQKLD